MLDNFDGFNSGAVIQVDPRTGAQTFVSANFILPRLFDFPFGIAVDRNGQIVVVNRSLGGALPVPCVVGTGSVFRVNPTNGAQTPISSLGRLAYPLGVAAAADGSLAVANECGGVSADGVVRIRPDGAQEHVTTNNTEDVLQTPERIAFDPSGGLLVTDYVVGADGDGGLVRVNPATGAQAVVTTDSLFNHPLGIAVVRNRPPTATLVDLPADREGGLARDPRRLRLPRPRGPAARLRVGPRRRRHLRGRLRHDADRDARLLRRRSAHGAGARQRPPRRSSGRRGHGQRGRPAAGGQRRARRREGARPAA